MKGKDARADEPADFESALRELERIASQIEAGDTPLERTVAAYRRGARLLAYCRGALENARAEIKALEEGELRAWSADDGGG